MKKWILSLTMVLLSAVVAWGQHYRLVIDPAIPAPAAEVLQARFTQMLEAGGCTVVADTAAVARDLTVAGKVVSRMETPGEMSQVMLAVEVEASCGDVKATFPLKGVGDNETDAWLRAVKQLLPRSKAAQAFVSGL